MVLGSAFWAFNEICPERFDMLHPHFRKVCHLLADIDEWGQVATLNTLTRYARTQFKNPEAAVKVSSFIIIALLWSPSLNPPFPSDNRRSPSGRRASDRGVGTRTALIAVTSHPPNPMTTSWRV